MWPRRGRRSPSEKSTEREVEERAGRLLCAFVQMKYRRGTARYLAEVIREGRWYELSPDVAHRLKIIEAKQLQELVSDILD